MSYMITIENEDNGKVYSFPNVDSCTWKTIDEVRYDGRVKHSLHITGNSITDMDGCKVEESRLSDHCYGGDVIQAEDISVTPID